jgi:hypothetical protein
MEREQKYSISTEGAFFPKREFKVNFFSIKKERMSQLTVFSP